MKSGGRPTERQDTGYPAINLITHAPNQTKLSRSIKSQLTNGKEKHNPSKQWSWPLGINRSERVECDREKQQWKRR